MGADGRHRIDAVRVSGHHEVRHHEQRADLQLGDVSRCSRAPCGTLPSGCSPRRLRPASPARSRHRRGPATDGDQATLRDNLNNLGERRGPLISSSDTAGTAGSRRAGTPARFSSRSGRRRRGRPPVTRAPRTLPRSRGAGCPGISSAGRRAGERPPPDLRSARLSERRRKIVLRRQGRSRRRQRRSRLAPRHDGRGRGTGAGGAGQTAGQRSPAGTRTSPVGERTTTTPSSTTTRVGVPWPQFSSGEASAT